MIRELEISRGIDKVSDYFTNVTNINNEQIYYREAGKVIVRYISDLHILHHVKYYNNNLNKTIKCMAYELAESLIEVCSINANRANYWTKSITVFIGDVASSKGVVIKFFKYFRIRLDYCMKKTSVIDRSTELYNHVDVGDIYLVLGNHELFDFNTVDEALRYYEKKLMKYKIKVLHNMYIEDINYILYGGTGFAKYNNIYNANSLNSCKFMNNNREYEIKETDIFEYGYLEALRVAKKSNKRLICVSHYATKDCICSNNLASEAVYFHGHDHQNKVVTNGKADIYSDNQVGYKVDIKSNIKFKFIEIGMIINPYCELPDGYYETNVENYLKYVRYVKEHISGHKDIDKKLLESKLYVIKSKGYYGFFIVSSNCIYILNGGKCTKINYKLRSIEDVYEHFDNVVNRYIKDLTPLWKVQSQISDILKCIGFDGRIHGLIVDVDFYNHIMLDVESKKIRYYYSPVYGHMVEFDNFLHLVDFICSNNYDRYLGSTKDRKEIASRIKDKFLSLSGESEDVIHSVIRSNELNLEYLSKDMNYKNSLISLPYKISKYVCVLDRLFNCRWLRKFELEDDIKYEIDNGKSTKINNRLHD